MKRSIYILIILFSVIGCTHSQPEHAPVPDKVAMANESQIKLKEGDLVSTNDTICGMSIGNEPGDTLTYDGKLYGFCSSGCKNAFVTEHKTK